MTGFDGQENINVLRQLNERYEPLELLGRSEFNEVYKVKDRLGRRTVALKVLQKNVSREAGLRLSREFFYLSQLAHSNIVRVFDYGLTIDNSPFFTMEFVPGVPITHFFQGYQPALFEVLIQILSALDAIHREGLVHCDIKPSNILVYDEEGKPKAKLLDLGFVDDMALSSTSPRGTLGYIAPELLKGADVDSRTDLYSLGLVLYEILTGVGPTSGGSLKEWLRRQYYSGFEPVSKFNPAVPAALDNLVLRLLNPDPRRRPANVEQLLEEFVSAGLIVPESSRTQIVAEPSVVRRDLLAPAFVGRGPLIVRLKELLGEAATGKPRVVFISGERGAGKSRLLGEFKFIAQLEQATVIAFEPVALGARTQSLVESLINLLYQGEQVETSISLDFFQESKFQLFEHLVRRLKALSDSHRVSHSLVLLVDDFELFDPLSLEFVRYLALSLEKERLLLVVTGLREKRLLDIVSELSEKPYCYHLDVDVLDRKAVHELVSSIVGDDDKVDELVDWIYEFGGGNPLATIEIIYSMIEQGVIFRERLRWRYSLESLRSFPIPKNVSELVRHRLEVLTPEERELLEVGAITANPFTIEFLRAVLNYPDRTLFQAISRLKELGLLRTFYSRDNEAEEVRGALILSSKVLETVVTQRIPQERCRELHRRVALALELLHADKKDKILFDLAHQWIQSGDREQAYRYALAAAKKAQEWLLFDEARLFYESALNLSSDFVTTAERFYLIERVGELREATGRYHEAIDSYRQGMSLAAQFAGENRTILARFLRRLGLVHQKLGEHQEAVLFLNQALALLGEKSGLESARLLADLGWSYCAAGKVGLAEDYLVRALRQTEQLKPGHPKETNYLNGLVLYYFAVLAGARSDYMLALQLAEQALDVFKSIGEQFMVSVVTQFLATLCLRRGDTRRAREFYEEAARIQHQIGNVYYLLSSSHGLGVISYEQGEFERAERHFTEALQYAERVGYISAAFNINLLLANLYFDQGEWSRAEVCCRRALKLSQTAGDAISESGRAQLAVYSARLSSIRGDFQSAEQYLATAHRWAENSQDSELEFMSSFVRTEMELRRERLELSKEWLIRTMRSAVKVQDWRMRSLVWLLAGQFRLAVGSRADFEAQQAVAAFRNRPISLEYAGALRLAARCDAAAGRKDRSRTQFEESIKIFRKFNAKYELGLTLLATAELICTDTLSLPKKLRGMPAEHYEWVRANLEEAISFFRLLETQIELERAEQTMASLEQIFGVIQLKARQRNEYLKIFYQLSELMNTALERDDFLEQVLELVLGVTRAERGIIFFFHRDRLTPVAVRDVENSTVFDAQAISHSVLRKVRRRHEPLISVDALTDPRFNSANSVILNKIRSLLCVPLVVGERVIGTIYLDSRLTTHLFTEEDQNLLQSVGHLIAATIERSRVYRRWYQETMLAADDLPVDRATGIFLGRSPAIRPVLTLIDKIAPTDCTVLLSGETGTGKGVLARLIHSRSGRKDNKFVAVDCGTLPETLFESELFGHVRGAFTGAVRDKIGIFESANGGTIFLDEITNTTPAIQAKLLQVLEDKIIRRLGETQTRLVDVRLICATNKNLLNEVNAGRFRQDLFYRMNVVTINVPPLRERSQDIIPLANYFLRSCAQRLNKEINGFEREVVEAFLQYSWPGNVRELQNTIERAVIMTQNQRIRLEDVGETFIHLKPSESGTRGGPLTRHQLLQALEQTGGNITRAAQLLCITRRHAQRLIKRYRIRPEEFRI